MAFFLPSWNMDPPRNVPAPNPNPPVDAPPGDLHLQQNRLLLALRCMRKSTTLIWRGQGHQLGKPPRRTLQQEAQGPMQITWDSKGQLQWTEPGSAQPGDTALDHSHDSLAITNHRLRLTLADEIDNITNLLPPKPESKTLATSPTGRTGRTPLHRMYAFAEGLGGRPLSSSPPAEELSTVVRTASDRHMHRQTPYPSNSHQMTAPLRRQSTQKLQPRAHSSLEAEDAEETDKEGEHSSSQDAL